MNERAKQRAGTVVAAALAADGLLHAFWATGRHWPARDARTLAHMVLNADDPRLMRPGVVGPLAVLLLLGALTARARVQHPGRMGRRIPDIVLQGGMLAITAGLLARGAVGIKWALAGDTGTTFARLNRAAYTPACLALGVAALAAARFKRDHDDGANRTEHDANLDAER